MLKRSTSTSLVKLITSLFSFNLLKKSLLITLLSAPVSNKASTMQFPILILILGTVNFAAKLFI